ncbi:MAG: bifunctional 5,10-methylenetetrahydrofolate dehydrogenase/5,10-methenyltetrahydrofolate cyclohydrolase [Patescibacteria group bacterium]
MNQIDGKKIASEILDKLKALPKPEKFFGATLIGNDPASEGFLKQKAKVAEELGIEFRLYKLPEDITTDKLREEIGRMARVKNCGGFIVQLPIPKHINKHYALNAIPKEKDVDILSETSLGSFYTGRSGVVPPSVGTVEEILKRNAKNLRECSVVLMGTGFLTGKPIGFWLQDQVAELTIIDEHSKKLRSKLADADIVISGAGVPRLFNQTDLKNGALVIDFGWNKLDGKIVGDFNQRFEIKDLRFEMTYTPTPGGTGPILVAKLFENFYTLNA